jgi:hypothetical protein
MSESQTAQRRSRLTSHRGDRDLRRLSADVLWCLPDHPPLTAPRPRSLPQLNRSVRPQGPRQEMTTDGDAMLTFEHAAKSTVSVQGGGWARQCNLRPLAAYMKLQLLIQPLTGEA